MNCDPASLARAAACYTGLPANNLRAVQIMLLCRWATAAPTTLPNKPINPYPANGATGVNPNGLILSWQDGGGAQYFNVYFNGSFMGTQIGTTYGIVGSLAPLSSYAWRIDAVNAAGTTTGDVWVLNTGAASFSYAPASDTMQWHDVNGNHSGDLAFFYANADIPSVTSVLITPYQSVTSISNISYLPAVTTVSCVYNQVAALDLSGCFNLVHLTLSHNSLNPANVSAILCAVDANGATNGTLDIRNNSVPTAGGLVCAVSLTGKGWTVQHD